MECAYSDYTTICEFEGLKERHLCSSIYNVYKTPKYVNHERHNINPTKIY